MKKINLKSVLFFMTFFTHHVLALTPTAAELNGINEGRLELSVVTVNGQTGPHGDGINDDVDFFNRAIELYKSENKAGFIILNENTTYQIGNKIVIKEQPGITIQGRGEGSMRSTIKINTTGNTPGIHIYKSNFSGLRKLRFTSTENHEGDAVRVDRSGKIIIHDLIMDGTYNGIRHVISNNLIASNIVMTAPKGNYGFQGIGKEKIIDENGNRDDEANHLFTMLNITGTLSEGVNTSFEWIKMGVYSVSYHLYDVNFTGGGKGIVTSNAPESYPKYIFASNVNITDTHSDGIHLKSGLDFQLSDISVTNANGHGIYISPNFTGGLLLTNPLVNGSQRHGIYLGGGEQMQIFNPEVGHNSESGLGLYSGIYVENGTHEFNIHYGVLGQLDSNTANNQKYGIELGGTMGTDHNYFSVVDVQEIGNQFSQPSVSDTSGNWFFKPRTTRVNVNTNDLFTDLASDMSLTKIYPENVTVAATGLNTLQTEVTSMCSNGGGTLWLKPGEYRLSSDLNIACDDIKIKGSGRCASAPIGQSPPCSTIVFANANSNVVVDSADNFELSDVYIKSNSNHNAYAIEVNNSDHAIVSDIRFGLIGSGVSVNGSNNTLIMNNYLLKIKNTGYLLKGTAFNPTNETTIYRSYMGDQSSDGNGTANLTEIQAHVYDSEVIQTVAIKAGRALYVNNDNDTSALGPIGIKGYLLATDHSSKEGIFIDAGDDIQLTNLWIGAQVNNDSSVTYSGIRIRNADDTSIGNAYIRGYDGNGLHLESGDGHYAYNFMIGFNGDYATHQENCSNKDGIRAETPTTNVVLRGGISGQLFKSNGTPHKQRRGVTIRSNDAFIKGVDLSDNCLSPSWGTPLVEQYNPGW